MAMPASTVAASRQAAGIAVATGLCWLEHSHVETGGGIPGVLSWQARALLTRLARVKPFALTDTMVPAAGLPFEAQTAIEHHLTRGRRTLERCIRQYLRWLQGAEAVST